MQISFRYAQAVLNVAQERHETTSLRNDLETLQAVLKSAPTVLAALQNTDLTKTQRMDLCAMLGDQCQLCVTTRGLLTVIIDQKIPVDIQDVINALHQQLTQDQNQGQGLVISAHPLAPETISQLEQTVSERFHQQIHLTYDIDPTLLGGLIIQVDSWLMDASLKTQLHTMTDRIQQPDNSGLVH